MSPCARVNKRQGFTLIELLVVIAIIGILIGLLVPATLMVLEFARSTTCRNNLRQLTDAVILHREKNEYYPTGGWNSSSIGTPGLGSDFKQPGGWLYNILPYLEMTNLYELGKSGTPGMSAANAKRVSTPVGVFYCPSRRRAAAYPLGSSFTTPNNCDTVTLAGRNDYAINGGTIYVDSDSGSPGTVKPRSDMANCNGICYSQSTVRPAHIRDGAISTLMLGEKYMNADNYTNGQDAGEQASCFSGRDVVSIRWGTSSTPSAVDRAPRRDKGGVDAPQRFGSAHGDGFNLSLCDGSARFVAYGIDPTIFERLSNRADLKPVDLSRF